MRLKMKPAEGTKVRVPYANRFMKSDGEYVNSSFPYWARMKRFGSIVEVMSDSALAGPVDPVDPVEVVKVPVSSSESEQVITPKKKTENDKKNGKNTGNVVTSSKNKERKPRAKRARSKRPAKKAVSKK
ncbi:MAG: hypothetical protein COA62_15685 [Rhodobiaceae bacterium]|nr:MAG: hypothetical protein COA62_15685 [Rhodobiaceae bacterium]